MGIQEDKRSKSWGDDCLQRRDLWGNFLEDEQMFVVDCLTVRNRWNLKGIDVILSWYSIPKSDALINDIVMECCCIGLCAIKVNCVGLDNVCSLFIDWLRKLCFQSRLKRAEAVMRKKRDDFQIENGPFLI